MYIFSTSRGVKNIYSDYNALRILSDNTMRKQEPQYAALKSLIKKIENGTFVVNQVDQYWHRQTMDTTDGETIGMDMGSTFTIHLSNKIASKFRRKIRLVKR